MTNPDLVDYSNVHADDAYLDALSAGRMPRCADPLAVLLLAWPADVDAQPMPELVTTDEAVAVVGAAVARRGCA